ncbi:MULTISPECIES: hypothetical protein [unclassified Kitasatospora]|uniref:hypothetical protein n=1 Tax=unclassified Kitasatospora TaxID=2633591 RepID=UPI0012F93173|nr:MULTISPECIES: hypothetical protein [unclassified Kitasatospora]
MPEQGKFVEGDRIDAPVKPATDGRPGLGWIARRVDRAGCQERFVTQRCHGVGLHTAGERLDLLIGAVTETGFDIASVEREFVVHGQQPRGRRRLVGTRRGAGAMSQDWETFGCRSRRCRRLRSTTADVSRTAYR